MLNLDGIGMDIFKRIEEQFDTFGAQKWMQTNWQFSVYASLFYIVSVVMVRKYMAERNAYQLRKCLSLWSMGLAIFSIIGVYKINSWIFHQYRRGGMVFTVCDVSYYHAPKNVALWSFLFVFSKLVELIDTLFIVLRKNQLILLHWYHHVTVFVYCWYFYAFQGGLSFWFWWTNFVVHSLMYLYYAIKANGHIHIPRIFNLLLTSLQLGQMVCGVAWTLLSYRAIVSKVTCGTTLFNIYMAFAMYFSYTVLFTNFFVSTYVVKKKK